jgi:hypothetical protein
MQFACNSFAQLGCMTASLFNLTFRMTEVDGSEESAWPQGMKRRRSQTAATGKWAQKSRLVAVDPDEGGDFAEPKG